MRARIVVLMGGLAVAGIVDAAPAASYRIVDGPELKAFWVADPGHEQRPPKYSTDSVRERVEACLELGFSIEPDGVPARFDVLRSNFTEGTPKQFVEIMQREVIDSVAATRYAAALENPQRQPVYTHRLFTFRISMHESTAEREAGKARISQTCRIDNLKAYLGAALQKSSPGSP